MTDPADSSHRASFGYRDVPASEKAGLVARVFESVAPRYDLMNDVMSAGVHRLWKNALIDALNPRPGERFLDVAGGTGDIAFRIVQRQVTAGAGGADVTVCDVNPAMLSVGRDRAADRGLLQGLVWTTGDAEHLPFPDRSFDGYTIAFGLRTVTDIDKALECGCHGVIVEIPIGYPKLKYQFKWTWEDVLKKSIGVVNYAKARAIPSFSPDPSIKPGEFRMQQEDVNRSQEFRKCIECFLCQNTCHAIRDHEDNETAFSGPRSLMRVAELEMHPADEADRRNIAQDDFGLGLCNITKCCTEVCPEHIKITDNALIPMKERIVGRKYDPLVWLGDKIARRPHKDTPKVPGKS